MKHRNYFLTLVLLLLISFTTSSFSQEVLYHVDNESLYDFLDELANNGVIDINTAVKPFSREKIAHLLQDASNSSGLTPRQRKDLAFYLKDFNKELTIGKDFDKRFDIFYHSDSLFKFTVNPILGVQMFHSGEELIYHRWNGAEVFGSVGKHFGFYASLRDNHESKVLGGPSILTQRRGAVYKGDDGKQDYSEARGGLTYTWKWGSVGIHKDHFVWGNNYNGSNIYSGHTPSFAFISFKMQPVHWFEFNYVHGWLVSEVVDSLRSYQYYDGTRKVYANKYMAANIFTFKPWRKLYFSFGNSMVYGDTNVNPVFLIPFMFYKSADHTYNSGSNAVGHNGQMYFDISSRQIKHLHLYTSLFIDEISINRMFDTKEHSNYISIKGGARVTDLFPNTSFTVEYTRTNPMVYQHVIPTTTFESNSYTMGHYLKDNTEELFMAVRVKPLRGLNLSVSYTKAKKGKDYQSIIREGEIDQHPEINPDEPRWGLPYMNEVRWKDEKLKMRVLYQIINDGYLVAEYENSRASGADKALYTAPFYMEGEHFFSFGLNFGF
ncbi:hypothetical protein DMA11_08540 [Marinilabiliaceae bacterium JC017]|nr:hypothetical protein DMA11_08540 [Marinilabiliaceae bacterium JC017]